MLPPCVTCTRVNGGSGLFAQLGQLLALLLLSYSRWCPMPCPEQGARAGEAGLKAPNAGGTYRPFLAPRRGPASGLWWVVPASSARICLFICSWRAEAASARVLKRPGGSSLLSSLSRLSLKLSIRVTFCGSSTSLTSNRSRSGSARSLFALIGQGGRSRERFDRLKLARLAIDRDCPVFSVDPAASRHREDLQAICIAVVAAIAAAAVS